MESIKWSLFTANDVFQINFKSNHSLSKSLAIFYAAKNNKSFNDRLILIAPLLVCKLHVLALNKKKKKMKISELN